MFLESIKFYEHVEVLLKFKSLISKRSVETPRSIMNINIIGVILLYHEYQARYVRYCPFLKATK